MLSMWVDLRAFLEIWFLIDMLDILLQDMHFFVCGKLIPFIMWLFHAIHVITTTCYYYINRYGTWQNYNTCWLNLIQLALTLEKTFEKNFSVLTRYRFMLIVWVSQMDGQTLTSSPLYWLVHHNQTTKCGGQYPHQLKLHIALK